MSPLTGDRELEAILPPAGVCREPEFTRGVDREAGLGSAGGLLTLPFGIAQGTELRPVIHSGSFIGTEVPVWSGTSPTNSATPTCSFTNMAQANDLAKCLGENSVALMRGGQGFASAARFADRRRAAIGLPAAQRMRADAGATAGRRDQVPVARRDRGPQPGYSPYSVETCT